MGVIVTGHNSPTGFQNSEAVTVSNLNSHVNDSSFDTTAVDNSSIELTNNDQQLRLKDSSSTTTGTTLSKLQYIGTNKVLGRTSASDGVVEQLTLDTDLAAVSASHNELASSKAIKDYVDTEITATENQIPGVGQKWAFYTRAFDTTYTNDTGRPITVMGNFHGNTDDHHTTIHFTHSDNTTVSIPFSTGTNSGGSVASRGYIIVPTGASYRFTKGGDAITSFAFYELR